MDALQIFFLIVGAATLSSALMVVLTRNLVHAALYLIGTLCGVAVLYILLNMPFLAMVQILVYVGAIAILMIFAVMLTRRLMQAPGKALNRDWFLAALIAAGAMAGLVWILTAWMKAGPGLQALAGDLPAEGETLQQLGAELVSASGYIIPFEIASVLLVAAMIGAIYVALERKK
jgi:NADH-quinone oxidoreductase subunit J